MSELVDEATMLRALLLLREKMARQEATGIYIFGGSSMVLVFKSRPATREVDAILELDTEVHDAAGEVAADPRCPADRRHPGRVTRGGRNAGRL